MTSEDSNARVRKRIDVRGIVQGVGFRPFVYHLARRFGLGGWVLNDSEGVKIEVEGAWDRLNQFVSALQSELPPLARIAELTQSIVPPEGSAEFHIRESETRMERTALISPDTNVCDDCLRELFDPQDRRYRYPFINCTNCGPRYTIIEDVPYDRPNTTMRKFKMCPECEREYHDPTNRRFHAQPNACPKCGPRLELLDRAGRPVPCDDPIERAAELLQEGQILAVKGLGGFHLAVDATNEEAVRRLRQRKRREEKPLAIMSLNLEAVREYAHISPEEAHMLLSFQRPIVLLRKRHPNRIAPSVAPKNKCFGVMLPCTPIQYLIFCEAGEALCRSTGRFLALVMTSGNLTEEPIAIENEEAVRRLAGIADYFLAHNRDICLRSDDSVARALDGPMVLRRSRGYVPVPVRLREDGPPLLAVGPELKNTICLVRGREAFLSQHIGDLKNVETLEFFEQTIARLKRILRIEPQLLAHDKHPLYLSTRYALEQKGIPLISVQHHHAHLAAVLAEHGEEGPAIGVCFDGTGYGDDGCIWGGEFLVGDLAGYRRMAHLQYMPLPGGDAAIRDPERMALSYLYATYGEKCLSLPIDFCRHLNRSKATLILSMIERGMNSPFTSSMGRLFDAVSALTGVCTRNSYEGQAAMELEGAAAEKCEESYSFDLLEVGRASEGEVSPLVVEMRPTIREVVEDIEAGAKADAISAKLHNCVISLTLVVCRRIRESGGPSLVALSGGCFQNEYLLRRLPSLLERDGFRVLLNRLVPPNDGGISLGQAAIARRSQLSMR